MEVASGGFVPSRTPVLLLYPANERRHRVKYGLDCFLDHILDHFKGGGGSTPSILREGWDTVYQYWGRGGRQSVITQGGVRDGLLVIVTTQGGVGGGCNNEHYWLMELSLDRKNYLNWFSTDFLYVIWLLRFADGKYRQATVATIVRANWKTNLGESRGIPGRDFRFRKLLCLRNRWSWYLRFPILQVQQYFWSIREHGFLFEIVRWWTSKIAIALVNSVCC